MAGNLGMVHLVAAGLGDFRKNMVFVGGSAAELYADIPEISDIRPTKGVDCVVDIQIYTYSDYGKLEEDLRKLGFHNDISKGAPVCRKVFKEIKVDFMPVNPDILGFSNQWYKDGFENRIKFALYDNIDIFILSVEYYVATKFEAMKNRGGTDIRGSHDWEDIVYVLDNCSRFVVQVSQCSNQNLVDYLKFKFNNLLINNNIREIIYSTLPYGAEEEHIDKILEIMYKLQ